MSQPSANTLALIAQGSTALANERKVSAGQLAKAKSDLDAAVAAQKAADQLVIDAKSALLVKANDAIATLTQDKVVLQGKLDDAVASALAAANQVPDQVAAAVQAFIATVLAGNAASLPPAEAGETVVGG